MRYLHRGCVMIKGKDMSFHFIFPFQVCEIYKGNLFIVVWWLICLLTNTVSSWSYMYLSAVSYNPLETLMQSCIKNCNVITRLNLNTQTGCIIHCDLNFTKISSSFSSTLKQSSDRCLYIHGHASNRIF